MQQTCPTFEINSYRLILLHSGSILTLHDGSKRLLPHLDIPHGTRPAEQLQQALKNIWQLNGIVLEIFRPENNGTRLAIVELLTSKSCTSMSTTGLNEITEAQLSTYEREKVQKIVAGLHEGNRPFARLGWMEEALAWLRIEVPYSTSSVVSIRQLNASGSFALIRFRFQSNVVFWMKATGDPNRHEFRVTRTLSQMCPEFLPPRIAEREDWNAWLMEDAGLPLDTWDSPTFEVALRSMSTLQKRTIGHTDEFIAQGAFDQRIHVLRGHLPEAIEYIDEAMREQRSTNVAQIDPHRLSQLEGILRDACLRLEDLAIPDTVVHNDINPGNALFKGMRCVFTDWSEIGVGNPFFTLHQLCRLRHEGRDPSVWIPRETYKQCWAEHLTAKQIESAVPLIPLLSIFSYFCGRRTWLQSTQRNDARVKSYSRSLARHMDQAARDPELLGALCH
jgi:hypothetical protein